LGFCVTVYKYQGDTIHTDYNIYEVDKLSWNEMYTALSRGVSLDKVHFKYTSKLFHKDKPDNKSVLFTPKPDHKYLNGKIYILADDGMTWVYIGSTCKELEERRKEHNLHPANKALAKVIETGKISLLTAWPCLSKKDLEMKEDEYIRKYIEDGYNVINSKINVKTEIKKDLDINIIQDVHITKFEIRESEKQKVYYISYTENGKYKQKNFKYTKCGKKAAMEKANKFKEELMKKFY
jgi:hypothetical protein